MFLVVWKDVTDKTLYEKRLQEMAIKDPLTKLSNRRAFIDKYNKRDKDAEYTFLLLDIDYFKHFNDRYGHFIGDKVLQQVADLIRQHFPEKDAEVTRLGGEELGVLLRADSKVTVKQVKAFQQALKITSKEIDVSITEELTVSVGVIQVNAIAPFEEIYQIADKAMYQAKDAGRDGVKVYQGTQ